MYYQYLGKYPEFPTYGFSTTKKYTQYELSKFIDVCANSVGLCKSAQDLGINQPYPERFIDQFDGIWKKRDGVIPDNHQFFGKYRTGLMGNKLNDTFVPKQTLKTTNAFDYKGDSQPSLLSERRNIKNENI